MRKIINKLFPRKIVEPIVMVVISFLILEFLIFPGLTIENTFINIISGIFGIILGLVFLTYADNIIKDYFEKKDDWGGLTNEELIGDDEIPNVKSKEKEDGKI
jgi:predicted membrane chloride channel (bestrophin family)